MFTRLRHLLSILIGDFSWHPPVWLAGGLRRLASAVRAHRLRSAIIAVLVMVAIAGGWWGFQWYKHRPKPETISVTAVAPGIEPLDPEALPRSARIEFGASVAKLEDLSKESLQGVKLSPAREGVWKWIDGKVLVFHPKDQWPAGQKYEVTLSRDLFPPHILLSDYDLTFQTPAFSGRITKSEFYTDPTDPAIKQVTATMEFTHRVDPADLEKLLSVEMIGGSQVFKDSGPHVSVTYGKAQRIAYIRTSPLNLPENEDFMRLTVPAGLHTTQGGAPTTSEMQQKVRVPDLYSFFRITSAEGMIVRNKDGEPEQILSIESTANASPEEMLKALRVYLLPKKHSKKEDDENDESTGWNSAKEVDEDVLRKATQLPVKLLPSDEANKKNHLFKISLETDGFLYVTIAKGTRAMGGFVLGEQYEKVMPVPELPREIAIEGDGGVLALSGERKLSIRSRGVKKIEYRIARVPADQINHLVSQTQGEFQRPEFRGYSFNEENIARIATETQPINMKSRFKANYSVFDFSKHLQPATDGGSPMQGLFFLSAKEWIPPKKKQQDAKGGEQEQTAADDATAASDDDNSDDEEGDHNNGVADDRFILVTDLGMIVKENADDSRDVFIASIATGDPQMGVSVQVLAKNGVPLVTGKTGPDGRVSFPSVDGGKREKKAVAIVARNGNDVAFMPYSRDDRRLDFSRFDIEGVESISGADLNAFVFTERGIYRPGDEIHIGLIVKQRDWQGVLEGLPVETDIIDPRGASVQVRKLALPQGGFAETTYQTAYESPTGIYNINLYLVRNGKRDLLLGSASVNVKEFLPDRMKIESHLSKEAKGGWIAPYEVKANVSLRNLYGTPATDRKMSARLSLSPARFAFEQYPGYNFFDRLRETVDREKLKYQTVELGDMQTDTEGAATFDLDLERFSDATYACDFTVEGFEAGSGRSVSTQNSVLVSALPYVVGYKPDGNLDYIQVGSQRSISWLAISRTLEQIAAEGLECRLLQRVFLSVLTKQENGNYEYESVEKLQGIKTTQLNLPAEGLKFDLPTDVPGEYILDLRDKDGARLSKVCFSVIGRGAISRSVEKTAELQVKLPQAAYNTGDDIEVSIVAPYTGSGLITIERDKVYAHTWFKADRNSTVQHIRVPEGFEGTGYINVCFVRGLDSKEVFMSPLSYATVPFRANLDHRRLQIGLHVGPKARPGEPLRIGYKTDRPSRIAVFAVDQGILQVTGYELPDPLSHFFRKEALMVSTSQIVDLILPEYSILKHAAFGGDEDSKHLNPFRRVTEKPVVFWSGVIDSGPREQEVVYQVPDYFSGTLTVMAVAVAPDAVGSIQKDSLIRGPFVITPNVPTVAAPGDQFEVSVTVANGVEGSGKDAPVRLVAEASEHLEILKAPELPVLISEGTEKSAFFTVRAREKLGSASLTFRAAIDKPGLGKKDEARIRSTLSVRPATPFIVSVRGGNFTRENVDAKTERAMLPDLARREATISGLPLGLARGLDDYMKNYPNGCSEQLTSGAFARLVLAGEADFGLSRTEIAAQMERTFSMLRRRQNDQGSFGYWVADGNDGIDFISVYVMHFLVEAKEAGFPPPQNVFQSGMRHLQAMVVLDPRNVPDARIVAYAIYLLTREGMTTTNYLLNLRDTIDKQHWNVAKDLTSVYMAGTYALLKKNDEAQKLIKTYRMGQHADFGWWDFHTQLGSDSQYVAIVARHFPDLLKKMTASEFQSVVKPIGDGEFNTLSAAYAVLALKSYSQHLAANPPALAISQVNGSGRESALHLEGGSVLRRARFGSDTTALRFTAKNQARGIGAFYQFVEAGFDQTLPTRARMEGLEVTREIIDSLGASVHTATLGEPVTVKIRVRSASRDALTNVAILDLLPGGFEIAGHSLEAGARVQGCDYVDLREDRVVYYTSLGRGVRTISYQIKPTACGEFTVPPIFAESMYERKIFGCGVTGRITVKASQ